MTDCSKSLRQLRPPVHSGEAHGSSTCRLLAASAEQTAAIQNRIRLRSTPLACRFWSQQPPATQLSRQHIGTVIMNTRTACTVVGIILAVSPFARQVRRFASSQTEDRLCLPMHAMRSESLIMIKSSKFTRITCHYAFSSLHVISKVACCCRRASRSDLYYHGRLTDS